MKKIFIIFLVLFVGLLVGCASKPVQKTSKSVQRTPDGPVQDVSKMRNMSDEELLLYRIDKDLDDIKAIVYAPVVTYDDIETARKLASFYKKEQLKEFRDKFSTKTTRKDFSGKITNTTNQEAHLKICPRYSYKAIGKNLPDVDITIPPHETIYYIVENFFALGQDKFFIADLDNPDSCIVYTYNSEGRDDEYHFFPIHSELFKTHSLETIYDPQAILNNRFCTYNFIEPLDEKIKNEKNLIIIHQAEKK